MFFCESDIIEHQKCKQMLNVCLKNTQISKLTIITLLVCDFDGKKSRLKAF